MSTESHVVFGLIRTGDGMKRIFVGLASEDSLNALCNYAYEQYDGVDVKPNYGWWKDGDDDSTTPAEGPQGAFYAHTVSPSRPASPRPLLIQRSAPPRPLLLLPPPKIEDLPVIGSSIRAQDDGPDYGDDVDEDAPEAHWERSTCVICEGSGFSHGVPCVCNPDGVLT